MTVTVTVTGVPAPQGSKRIFNGRVVESSKALQPWRFDVRTAALTVMGDQPPLDGPLDVRLDFRLRRPASRPRRHTWPDRRPDLDKLTRAVLDALTPIVWRDDSQVCILAATKRFAAPTEPTGVTVTVERLP